MKIPHEFPLFFIHFLQNSGKSFLQSKQLIRAATLTIFWLITTFSFSIFSYLPLAPCSTFLHLHPNTHIPHTHPHPTFLYTSPHTHKHPPHVHTHTHTSTQIPPHLTPHHMRTLFIHFSFPHHNLFFSQPMIRHFARTDRLLSRVCWQWRNRRVGGGRVPPRDFWPGNFCWRIGKKEERKKGKRDENWE